jgi:ABC-type multidrug transport system fused ATPase/permease subunit
MKRLRELLGRLAPIVAITGPYRPMFYASMAVGMVAQLLQIAAAGLGAWLVGAAITGTALGSLTPWLITLAVVAMMGQVCGVTESWMVHAVSWRSLHDLRLALHDRFDELGPGYLLERRSGDVARVALADVNEIENYTSHVLPPLLTALVVPIGATSAIAILHPLLAVVLLPFLVAVAAVPFWLGRHAEEKGRRARTTAGALGAVVIDAVQGLREIVAFTAQDRALDDIARAQDATVAANLDHARRVAVERTVTGALLSTGMLATLAVGSVLVTAGSLDTARFPAAVVIAGAAFAPLVALTFVGGELQRIAACADRVWTILRAVPPVRFTATNEQHVPDPVVVFDNVAFAYPASERTVLDGVTFTVHPGETVALVGRSGAGKSTCAHLLQRFWDPAHGTISIGGVPLDRLPEDQLRRLVCSVPQDVYLFNTSIADNVAIGRPDATRDEIRRAARLAAAEEFIDALPDGFDTVVGERATTLSGGQRQRLAIARALLRDTPIVVFDEAVSNLDTESEAAIRRGLAAVAAGRTTLVIAHRLSTIRRADRIVMLDAGRVVDTGTYDELLTRGGPFAELVQPTLQHERDIIP